MQSIYIYIHTAETAKVVCYFKHSHRDTTHTIFYIRSNPLYHVRSSAALTQDLTAKRTQKQEDLSSWPAAHGVSSDCDSCAKAVGAVYWESYCTVLLKDMRKLHWNRCLTLSNAQTPYIRLVIYKQSGKKAPAEKAVVMYTVCKWQFSWRVISQILRIRLLWVPLHALFQGRNTSAVSNLFLISVLKPHAHNHTL